ncbi:head completion/stabilization protein [Vibrio olivae]
MFAGSTGANYQDTTITNDGFWPDINAGAFEQRRGIPAAQDGQRIAIALVNAMAEVNQQVASLKQSYLNKGYESAAKVPAFPKLNDKPRGIPVRVGGVCQGQSRFTARHCHGAHQRQG